MGTEREFDAIFYDLGGTLRLVERDAAFEAEARRKIAEMCGEKGDPDEFCKFLKNISFNASEYTQEELWTKWLTPEYDRDLIKKNAIELTIEYRNKDGRRVVAPNGAQSIKDLYANGYKLGIISNLVTSQEIPRWLEADDLGKYFGAVLLSCVEGIRKPDPRIFEIAMDEMHAVPAETGYVGDTISRDVLGSRNAGLGLCVRIDNPSIAHRDAAFQGPDAPKADYVVHELPELVPILSGINGLFSLALKLRDEAHALYDNATLLWTVVLGLLCRRTTRNKMDGDRNDPAYGPNVMLLSQQAGWIDGEERTAPCTQLVFNWLKKVKMRYLDILLAEVFRSFVEAKLLEKALFCGCFVVALDATKVDERWGSGLSGHRRNRMALEAKVITPWKWALTVAVVPIKPWRNDAEKQDCGARLCRLEGTCGGGAFPDLETLFLQELDQVVAFTGSSNVNDFSSVVSATDSRYTRYSKCRGS